MSPTTDEALDALVEAVRVGEQRAVARALTLAERGGQRGGQDLAGRGVGVAGQPAHRFQQLAFQQRRVVDPGQRLAQAGVVHARRPEALHDPHRLALAERHPHPPPDVRGRGAAARRRTVIEQARQRHRQGDAEHGFGGGGHGRKSRAFHSPGMAGRRRAQLRPKAVRPGTLRSQVAVAKGDLSLSTQHVDKSVHGCAARGVWTFTHAVFLNLAKNAPNVVFPLISVTCP